MKNTFKHELLNHMTYVVNDLLECLSIELTDLNNNENITTCLYRQPDSSIDNSINNIEKLFRNKQRNIYLCGNFNINLFSYYFNNQVNNFLDFIYSLGLFPLITKPTLITSHSATLIDNIFTNIHDYAHMSGIIVCDIIDHFPVFTCKKVITHTCRQIFMTSYYKVRNHSEVNMIKLYVKLGNEKWNAIYDTNNVDEAYSKFKNTVSTLYNECCPFRNVQ